MQQVVHERVITLSFPSCLDTPPALASRSRRQFLHVFLSSLALSFMAPLQVTEVAGKKDSHTPIQIFSHKT